MEGARVGKPESYGFDASLRVAEVQGDKRRLVRCGTFVSGPGGTGARPEMSDIEVAIEKLTDDLFRLKPLKPLPAGEFVLLPGRAVAEVSVGLVVDGRYRPGTAVYGFGVEPK